MSSDITIQLPKTIEPNLQLPDPDLLRVYEDRQNRVLWMLGEIDDEAFDWVDFIIRCNREDKGLAPDARKPIKCILSNYGGSLTQAKTLSEIIMLSKTPIYGMVIGMCASAASIIFLSCHKKFATQNATILLHKGSCDNIGGSYTEVQQFMDSYKRAVEQMSEFYKKKTAFAPEEIDERLAKGDWYIYIDEAIEKGLVDEVITDIDLFY